MNFKQNSKFFVQDVKQKVIIKCTMYYLLGIILQTRGCHSFHWNPKTKGHKLKMVLTKHWPGPTIVNRRDWLGSPTNIKGTNKDAKIYVGRSTTLHNLLCMSYLTNTFLLVSSSVRSNNYQVLCIFKAEKQSNNIQQRTLTEVHNHSPLFTMDQLTP